MLITVEFKEGDNPSEGEIALCFNNDGIDFLINKLSLLRRKKDHDHLMTPSWAGIELSENKQGGKEYKLIHHLRLVKI